ncbi:MAG TPA: hypothetical protein VEI01_02110 [Terriglobales bacterium]|nr:hypothetical protein [Terriglobales bacterium]HXY48216.1 hypothetical protein [Terriglobales bacterium]
MSLLDVRGDAVTRWQKAIVVTIMSSPPMMATWLLPRAQRSLRNFAVTLLQSEAPDVISQEFKGKRVTVQTLKSQGHRPDLFGEYFDR